VTTLTRPRLDPLLDAPLVGPRVLSLVGDVSGCSLWRVWQPTAFLRLHGYPCDWVFTRDPSFDRVPLGAYQAIVLCRLAWHWFDRPGPKATLRRWQRAGIKVFFEADDDLFTPFVVPQQLNRVNPEKSRREVEADREAAQWVLRMCDGVTVSAVPRQHRAASRRARWRWCPTPSTPSGSGRSRRGAAHPPRSHHRLGEGNRPDADLGPRWRVAWGRIARRTGVTFAVMGHDPPIVRHARPAERLVRVPWLYRGLPQGAGGHRHRLLPVAGDAVQPQQEAPSRRGSTPWRRAVVASPTVYRRSSSTSATPGCLHAAVGDGPALLLDAPGRPPAGPTLERTCSDALR
jgi:hypothetical protein